MLKNSKVVLFLSPYKVGQAGNFLDPITYILHNIFIIDGDGSFLRHRQLVSQTTVQLIHRFECADPALGLPS